MAVTIPCAPGADGARWSQRTSLAGQEYVLAFDWCSRTGHWLLSLADLNGDAIASGMVLVTAWRLLRTVIDARRPPGELVVVDTTGASDLDAGFADLGARFQLVYFDPGELGNVLP